jgi:hypothetical protein
MSSSRSAVARAFAIGNALIAAGVLGALSMQDDSSTWLVAAALLLALLLLSSSIGLLRATRWRLAVLSACAWTGLGLAGCALAALAISATEWSAHAALDRETLGLALLLPYLLLYPCGQLLWAHRQQQAADSA